MSDPVEEDIGCPLALLVGCEGADSFEASRSPSLSPLFFYLFLSSVFLLIL